MTDGIGRLSGYGYGIGGFMPRNNKEEVAKDNQLPSQGGRSRVNVSELRMRVGID